MELLDLTLPDLDANLALDEALLEAAQSPEHGEAHATERPAEMLRLWESPQTAVVVGRASRLAQEVRLEECRRRGVSIRRRVSGGTAVVIGPGCLMYAVVLSLERRPHLRAVDEAHRHVLGTLQAGLAAVLPQVRYCGLCDLALDGRKFSGNALRVARTHLLYHGTILYDFDLEAVSALLGEDPPRQPDYRQGRPHRDFVCNVPAPGDVLRTALRTAWRAHEPLTAWPQELTARLAQEKYSQASWNERF